MDKGIIIIEPGTTLILKANCVMNPEHMITLRKWYKEHMDLDVKIIDGRFEVQGIEHGERVGKEIL